MSNYRINLIAALCAIALCAPLNAQTTEKSNPPAPAGSEYRTATDAQPSPLPDNDGAKSTGDSTKATEAADSSRSMRENAAPNADANAAASSAPHARLGTSIDKRAQEPVTRASEDAQSRAFGKFKGQRVRDSNGQELGKIHDFVLDATSGEIRHVIVSTGGVLGVGDKLRVLPHGSLQASAVDGYTSDMDKAKFEAQPAIAEKDLKAGNLSAAHASAADVTKSFVRASQLDGKKIRSGEHNIGKIEQVIINLESGQAMALIDADSAFARTSGKFIVPFRKLEVRTDSADRIHSSLMPSDFSSEPTLAVAGTPDVASSAPAEITTASTAQNASPEARVAATSAATPSSTADINSPVVANASASAAPTQSGLATSTAAPASPTTEESRSSVSGQTGIAAVPPTPSTDDAAKPITGVDQPDARPSIAANDSPKPVSADDAATRSPEAAPTSPSTPTSSSEANPSTSVASTPIASPATVTEEQLTPTGRSSADQTPASAATAAAIRQALDRDETLARENVQVTTKIVLRGSVQSEEAKQRVEQLAKEAAHSAEIDNQLTVDKKD